MPETHSTFRLDVLQDQWLLLALFIATAVVFAFFLAYLTAWRRTQQPAPEGSPGAPAAAPKGRRVPWVLLLLYVITVAYMIMYVVMQASNPPNW